MAKDIKQTRREKVVVHLLENSGEMGLGPLSEWAAVKLLCAHQAFSDLMEGMVEDGLVRWDGSVFSLHSEGRTLARKVLESAGKDPDAVEARAEAAPEADHGEDHGHDHGHSHDHGGGHDHGHSHEHGGGGSEAGVPGGRVAPADKRYGDGSEVDLPKAAPRRPPPPPVQPPPKSGLRASIKGALKKLIGRS